MVKERHAEPAKISRWRDYIALTKPRITAMCVMMTAGGYWLAHSLSAPPQSLQLDTPVDFLYMLWTLLGSALVIGGSCAMNMYLEKERDRLMMRTALRPLPAGRLSARAALGFALLLSALGLSVLWLAVNTLTAVLAFVAWVVYVGLYTPMKTRSPLFLLVGTVPGAMPPLMGWTAITQQIDWIGGILFAILVFWQLPHFLALSVMLQKDYASAGVQVASVLYGEKQVKMQALLYSLILLPVSLTLIPLQVAGLVYATVAMTGGLWMISIAMRAVWETQSSRWAPRLFFASLIYLPVLTLGLLLDQLF